MIFTIAAKELRSLFFSPLAWVVMAIVMAINAYFFLIYLEHYLEIQPQLVTMTNPPGVSVMVVAPLFATVAIVLLLVVPLITMRLISGEIRNNTFSLLTSAPLTYSDIVIGKFTGALIFLVLLLLLICLMPLSLLSIGGLDFGILLSGIFGLLLLLGSFISIGIYMSSLTHHPTVAAISTFGILLLLWIIDIASAGNTSTSVVSYLSMLNHYQSLTRGIFSSTDVVYYMLFTLVFIVLTIRRLNFQRLHS